MRTLPWLPARLLAIAFIAQGCAHSAQDSATTLDCAALNGVIDAARHDFKAITGAQVDTRYGAIWRANIDAYGRDCSLLSSGGKPRSYFCSITDPDQSAAMNALTAEVEACLGPAWERTSLPRPGSRFTRPDDPVIVDVGSSDIQASRASAVGLIVRAP